ncbi:trypsin-like peptidase domain-containing protein [Streptomyces purpureus]|uniref:Protease n=2 Tax=Streptomyces purpureus TaxID=1951 RepID=A0A918LR13_9ACTN|nr:trypsin-like peptidase domain-containing protein [Streptomyces purpureus]GGT39988.1 protease [Streptomyces purpureus]
MNDGKPTGPKPPKAKWWSRPPRPATPPPAADAMDTTPDSFDLAPPTPPAAGTVTAEAPPASVPQPKPTDEAQAPSPAEAAASHPSGAPAPAGAVQPSPPAPIDMAKSVGAAPAVLTEAEATAPAPAGAVQPTPPPGDAPAALDVHARAVAGSVPPQVPSAAAEAPAPARTPGALTDSVPSAPPPATEAASGSVRPGPEPGRDAVSQPSAAEPSGDAGALTAPVAAAPADAPRATPLHQPDPYSTPPYGGPGPWAPAPPVQRPGAPAPGPAPAAPAPGAPGPAPAAYANPQPVPPAPQAWVQYDPWSAPGQRPPAQAPGGRKVRRGLGLAAALAFALVTGVLGGGIGAYIERNGGITTVELPQAGPENVGRAPDSVAGIAASALPSVVTIHVSGGGAAGTGTGFVLDKQGHILTNNHVVDPAGSSGDISVTFSGGETARAKLVGKDSGYDLAVVQVTGVSNLKPLPLGNSDNVRVGDPVVAIGAPFDLQNTVTSGIISAKERPITAGGEKGDGSDISYVDALQTDAPINPGNSGGPLVDSKARVIGINSAIRAAGSGSGPDGGGAPSGSIGLGFAIPINQGKRVAEELINTGKATHPVIGVSLDMKYTGDGARVGEKGKDDTPSVTVGGPAAKAGIRPGDIITKVDGQRVHNGEELIVKIRAHRPGDRLELTLLRGGKELTKTLTLGSSQGA